MVTVAVIWAVAVVAIIMDGVEVADITMAGRAADIAAGSSEADIQFRGRLRWRPRCFDRLGVALVARIRPMMMATPITAAGAFRL
jgi:hypothetical protein